jgi:hypothetical protein
MLNSILESLLGEQSSKPLNAKRTLINNVVEVPNRHTGRAEKDSKGGGRGVETYDRKKPWCSINQSIL